jgi:hypothetical protein
LTGEDEEGNPTTDDTNTHVVEAISGAGAASVGVAGSAAINVVVNTVLAHNDGDVTLNGGNAEISAASNNESTTTAGAVVKIEGEGENQKSSVGVGAAFATNVITNIIRAYLADNASLTGAANLKISSELANTAETTATAGADPIEDFTGDEKASESKIGLDAAVALTIVVNEVKAYSGTGSTIGANGNAIISAVSISNTESTAQGNASGSKVAVGACLALNVIVAATEAALNGNATIGGSLTVSASSTNKDDVFALATARGLSLDRYINKYKDALNNLSVDDILNGNFGKDENGKDKPKPKSAEALEKYDAKTAQTVDQNGGTGEGSQSQQSICVAAAIAINVTTHDTIASTGGGIISVGGNILISSASQSDFETLATGIAVGEGNSIGVAVAISTIFNDTSAALGQGSTAGLSSTAANGNDITIQAISSQNMSEDYRSKLGSQAIAGAGTGKDGKIGAAGALAIVTSFAKTQAYVAPNANISDAGIINIIAEETSKLAVRAWGFSAGTGKVGAGAAFAIIYGNNQINAYIGKAATVSAQGLNIRAEKKRVSLTDFEIGFDFDEKDFTRNIFEGLELLNFLSSNNYYGEAIAGSGTSGTAALAGAFVVLVFNNVTAAYIDENAVVNIRGDINISSKADVNAKAIGGSAAGAEKAGIGITTVNIVNADAIRAYIGKNAVVKSDGNIQIGTDADQELTILSVSGSGASTAGVAGIFAVIFTKNVAEAYIGEGATVKSKGSLGIKRH